ncbi:MAG: hypothetical protein ACW97P_08365, partial [Candidatus Hodarchaeales archaeon]
MELILKILNNTTDYYTYIGLIISWYLRMSQYLDRTTLHDEEKEIEDQQPIVDHVITNRTDLVVFNALKEHQPATRMDLCDKTGIARTTIYDALTRLMV